MGSLHQPPNHALIPPQGLKYYVPTLYYTCPLIVYGIDTAWRFYRAYAANKPARIVALAPLPGGATRVEVSVPGACTFFWVRVFEFLGFWGVDGWVQCCFRTLAHVHTPPI